MSIKKCSKCGNNFECCNEKGGCWCETLYIDIKKLNELKRKFANCLCNTCLKEYSKSFISEKK